MRATATQTVGPGVHLLVQAQRTEFEKGMADQNEEPRLGALLKWKSWGGRNQEFVALKQPGTMWIVTIRPSGDVWLIAMYERARLENGRPPFRIKSAGNQIRVVDITHLVPDLRFEDRRPITTVRDRWKNAFQRVSRLSHDSIRLLQIVAGQPVDPLAAGPSGVTGVEGELVEEMIRRRTRDAALRRTRLLHDGHRCQACAFLGHSRVREKVVDVHHVDPLRDVAGNVTTKLDDLVTLCPTCHRLVHAMAGLLGRRKGLDVAFLRRAEGSLKPHTRLLPGA
jgi:HNH endonuclease